MDKQTIRDTTLALRRGISSKEKLRVDKMVTQTVLGLPEVTSAHVVGTYISLPEEVDTRRIIETLWKQGKSVMVPKIIGNLPMLMPIDSWTDVRPGEHNILEPIGSQFISVHEVDVFLVPGVAFDTQGNRLGWGKGYYDKLLAKSKAPKIGIAYACQIVPRLPAARYDIPMNTVITEKRFKM